ncbi:hypothetical protein OYC64_013293 [Pagothenia borchgrevinki]
MMAVMVYAASLPSTDGTLKVIREEAGKLNKSLNETHFFSVTKIERNQTDSVDKFLCLAQKALARINDAELLNKTDKLIRQLLQYNLKHTTSCVLNTKVRSTLKALLDQIEICYKIKILG